MELNITGNPGTGNTFAEVHLEFHIDHVETIDPNVAATFISMMQAAGIYCDINLPHLSRHFQ